MRRFSVRLKSMTNAFREWKESDTGKNNLTGFVEASRAFGTSNDISVEGRSPSVWSLQEDIVGALHLGEKNRASHLLSKLGRKSKALQASDFTSIFMYCASTPDPLFVMEILKLMEEKDIELSGKCYYLTIQALCKGGYLKEAFDILSLGIENSLIYPTLPIYNCLLGACVQMRSLSLSGECLDLMEQHGVGKNTITYHFLLKLAVLQKDLSAVHKIWKEYVNLHNQSLITLRTFVKSFTGLRDLESGYITLQHMVALAFQRKGSITRTPEGKLVESALDIPVCDHSYGNQNENNRSRIPPGSDCYNVKDLNVAVKLNEVANEVTEDGSSASQQPSPEEVRILLVRSFNDVIHACASFQNAQLARQLMSQMQSIGLELSCCTYDGVIKALLSVNNLKDGIDMLKVMQQRNITPNDSTLGVLSVSCSQAFKLDLAENFLNQISKCRHAFSFNAFLEACDTLDLPERALSALAKMRSSNVQPDIKTYEFMFSLFGRVNAPYEEGDVLSRIEATKRIDAIEMDMMKHGIQHNHATIHYLLGALRMEGMAKELIRYMRVAEDQFLHGNTLLGIHIYNTVLHSLVDAEESYLAIEIFKSMVSCGHSLHADAATYAIMIECFSTIKYYPSALALVSMMIRNGFFPNLVSYTSLIKILLNYEDFHGVLKLLDQARLEGVQPDVVMYNTILETASKKGRIDVIEVIIEQMHRMEIQPDPSTCSHVVSAYVDNGYYNTAMEALQVLCMRMISEQDSILEEYQSKYENLISDDNVDAESQIVSIFKGSAFRGMALLYLRWCAILGFPISWLPNQSLWAKRLSSNYPSRYHG